LVLSKLENKKWEYAEICDDSSKIGPDGITNVSEDGDCKRRRKRRGRDGNT
jgi:hypothetical protein